MLDYPDLVMAHGPSVIGTSTAEFGDGVHGGNVAYARLAIYMAKNSPATVAVIDSKASESMVARWSGRWPVGLTELRRAGFNKTR